MFGKRRVRKGVAEGAIAAGDGGKRQSFEPNLGRWREVLRSRGSELAREWAENPIMIQGGLPPMLGEMNRMKCALRLRLWMKNDINTYG